jgi:hypothetical protein
VATNSSAVKRLNHAPDFSFGHCLLCKWIVLAKAKLGKEFLRWGQFHWHKRHEQLPMPLAIEVEKGIAKSFF